MARQEMLGFIRSLFRGRPDLSTLTHSIVRRRFLAHTGRACLDAPDKRELKRLVEEELLKMQVEEASVSAEEEEEEEEKRDLVKKVKRPRPPCRDPARKKPRFDSATGVTPGSALRSHSWRCSGDHMGCRESNSEPSSGASSPDANDPLAKNRVTTETGAAEERPRRVSKKRVESSDEEQHEDVTVKTAPRGDVKESSEEEEEEEKITEGKKDEKDESSEGKEDEKGGTESTGRTRKPPGTSKKRALGKASARRKPAREVSEDSEEEEERSQRTGKKMGRKTRAKSHQESEGEEKQVEEEEDWKSRPQSNGRKRTARHPGSEDGTVQDASGSEADSSGEEPSTQKKGKDRLPREEGDRQRRSSAEDGEGDGDESSKAQPAKGTGRPAKAGKLGSGESDSEREVSGSEAEGSPKGERKNRTSNKDSKKGRTRNSSSSSSDGSPEPKGRKAGSGRSGEDHPAVMRLKRYIRACGAHRNYKKLLGSCHSRKECLSVLRAELEALGMKGNPSLEKCRALRERREEEAEVASLDVSNIINCSGRPRRRTAWNPSAAAPPGELYRRTLDSEDEQPRPPPPDWSHMRGIISSDGDSN